MLAVAVKEPVSGAMIMASASLVRVNSTVHFTASATNGGPVFTYTWKVVYIFFQIQVMLCRYA